MKDTIIIGAGPAGMAAALYLKRAGKEVLLFDKESPGGQILKVSKIENYLGFISISGPDLALNMYKHIRKNEVPFKLEEVIKIQKSNQFFSVKTQNNEYISKNVIIAVGRTPNKLNIKGEDKIKGISYCAICDGTFYKDKIVGVVGGGNSAFSNALYLSDLSKEVYIFVKNKITADEKILNQTKKTQNIIIVKETGIKEIREKNGTLVGVTLPDKKIDLDGLFVSIGGRPKVDFNDDILLDGEYIIVDKNQETSVKGIYACGDVVKKDFYQIATAINDGIVAALNIKKGD